ncbi:HAD-IA family hydrolase [Oceanobacter sp. 5_MG-2023]|uniref:HAD family hydrolase n=1 Tax=Oceanobacter sp. 5_MG-2023 TaxID=3062645 RepID=UPI0026E41959|nr:HAD-IA family hydrolase [Oceanobacter sp. 5_MG-2023]MDO6682993.1 HAD-IA family hydrolase [Oceanobacter sp. 5_MG-2023]
MSQPHPHAILFDLDGTLLDSAPDFFGVVNSLRQEQGKPPLDHKTIRQQVSNGGAALTEITWEISRDHPEFSDYREQLLNRYGDYLATASALFPGFRAVLDELQLLGVQWGIVTNKPRRFAVPLLEKLTISAPVLVCADDVRIAKPDPESLLLAAAQLELQPEACWYVGDHLRDIQAGKAAGMRTIAALFGYIEDHDDPQRWQADNSIHTADELITLLGR